MSELDTVKNDIKWIKTMLSNHLKYHERLTIAMFASLVSAMVAAGTGIISLIIAVSKGGN